MTEQILKSRQIDTPLGSMLAIADETALYLLEFVERGTLVKEVERLSARFKSVISSGENAILASIAQELKNYFAGKQLIFNTPIKMLGTAFQQNVWQALLKIPVGETRAYLDIAKAIAKPAACRAVANANGANQLALIIPCHRVINADGQLGGYGAGVERKQWLLEHEKRWTFSLASSKLSA